MDEIGLEKVTRDDTITSGFEAAKRFTFTLELMQKLTASLSLLYFTIQRTWRLQRAPQCLIYQWCGHLTKMPLFRHCFIKRYYGENEQYNNIHGPLVNMKAMANNSRGQ